MNSTTVTNSLYTLLYIYIYVCVCVCLCVCKCLRVYVRACLSSCVCSRVCGMVVSVIGFKAMQCNVSEMSECPGYFKKNMKRNKTILFLDINNIILSCRVNVLKIVIHEIHYRSFLSNTEKRISFNEWTSLKYIEIIW